MPVLLRIENLLDSQITLLNETFARAIAGLNYRGIYRGVFPIKVNQQCQVIEEIAHFGARLRPRPRRPAARPNCSSRSPACDPDASYIVCNGYKDEEFIDLGLHALKLGYRCIFVLEMPDRAAAHPRTSRAAWASGRCSACA